MDLVKIGKYIASKRRQLGMTQRQLAEKLGMSDKSVSKWERGACLPDVSVYSDLCQILGISLNEFLAGEDIAQDSFVQKSEANIISVIRNSKQKQRFLKSIIAVLLVISIAGLSVIGALIYQELKPQNHILPLADDSIEKQTAKFLAEGAFVYKFTTTDEYKGLKIYTSEYHFGKLVNKDSFDISFDDMKSPESGEILIAFDSESYKVKQIVSADGCVYSTEFPILDNVKNREYYANLCTEISEPKDIKYGKEQALAAYVFDGGEIRTVDLDAVLKGKTDQLSESEYVYFFSFEFLKG